MVTDVPHPRGGFATAAAAAEVAVHRLEAWVLSRVNAVFLFACCSLGRYTASCMAYNLSMGAGTLAQQHPQLDVEP